MTPFSNGNLITLRAPKNHLIGARFFEKCLEHQVKIVFDGKVNLA
jgi:hypothetical protein